MIRKFLLPVVAVAALAGCATGYGYRSGAGDYYHGRSQGDYRPYGGYTPYGGYYGGGYYGSGGYIGGGYYGGRYHGGVGYGYPYGYGRYGYGSYPYYGNPYYRYPPVYYPPRPPRDQGGDGNPTTPPDNNHGRDRENLPPWRRIGNLPPPPTRVEGLQRQVLAQPQHAGRPRAGAAGDDAAGGRALGRALAACRADGAQGRRHPAAPGAASAAARRAPFVGRIVTISRKSATG